MAGNQGRSGESAHRLTECVKVVFKWEERSDNMLFMCSHLRYDTLAQMLTLANIHAGSKILVFETCAGLVLGAIMERMGGMLVLLTSLLFLTIWLKDFRYFNTTNVFCSVLSKQSLLFPCCIIALSFLLIQATGQWSKCTQEVGLFGRV